MSFVQLTLINGTPIALNPLQIRALHPAKSASGEFRSCVYMGPGEEYYVQEEYTDILDKVSEAVGE
jgi:uncharacterized protein YlzI (FlbEa/FlbD family)